MSCNGKSGCAINQTNKSEKTHVLNFSKNGISMCVDLKEIKNANVLIQLSDDNVIDFVSKDLEIIHQINQEWANSIFDRISKDSNKLNFDILFYGYNHNRARKTFKNYIEFSKNNIDTDESRELYSKIVDKLLTEEKIPLDGIGDWLHELSISDIKILWEKYTKICDERKIELPFNDLGKLASDNLEKFENEYDLYEIIKMSEKCSTSNPCLFYDVMNYIRNNTHYIVCSKFIQRMNLKTIVELFGNPYLQRNGLSVPMSNVIAHDFSMMNVPVGIINALNNPRDSESFPLSHQLARQGQYFSSIDIYILGNPLDKFNRTIYHYMAIGQPNIIKKKQLLESLTSKDYQGNVPIHFIDNIKKFGWIEEDFDVIKKMGNPKDSLGSSVFEHLRRHGVSVPDSFGE